MLTKDGADSRQYTGTSVIADPLSVPVWMNTYAETRKPLADPLAPSHTQWASFNPLDGNVFSAPENVSYTRMQQTLPQTGALGNTDSLFEPAGTPSTLRSPSDNGLMSRTFSPTGVLLNSAISNNAGYDMSMLFPRNLGVMCVCSFEP
jgi:hypothetical protein